MALKDTREGRDIARMLDRAPETLARLRAAVAETAAREAAASGPLDELHERRVLDGLAWYVTGPRGKEWLVDWRRSRPGDFNVRAWPLNGGHASPLYWGSAPSEDEARQEAVRLAGDIRRGDRAALQARDAATVAAQGGEGAGQ